MRVITSFAFFAVSIWFVSAAATAGPITYFVEPVALPDGYAVDGGFIQTNGHLGPLDVSDILDYEFVVTGPSYPYTFTPSNPGAVLSIVGDVTASLTAIVLPIVTEPIGSANGLKVYATDNGDLACQSCEQVLSYANGLASNLDATVISFGYEELLFVDSPLDITDFPPDIYAQLIIEPQQLFTIATVPEPGTIVLGALAGAGLLLVRRRCRRMLASRGAFGRSVFYCRRVWNESIRFPAVRQFVLPVKHTRTIL